MKPAASHHALILGVFLLFWAAVVRAEVKPCGLLQDGVVLQREMKVPVWGKANPGERVTVSFSGQSKSVVAGPDSKWMIHLDPMSANSAPQELTIVGTNTIAIKNVLVGDVWLASGQSNMEYSLNGVTNAKQEIAAADFPLIRSFFVPKAGSLTPVEEVNGTWKVCSPQTAASFSGVAYFFARDVFRAIKVPIGILESYYGGTPAEAWTSRVALDTEPEFKRLADAQTAELAAASEIEAFSKTLPVWEAKYDVSDTGNQGFKMGWAAPDANTSDWKPISSAGFNWAQALGAKSGGVFWLRKEVNLPESAAGKSFTVSFGWLAEEYDTVYFNGEEIGGRGRNPPDYYTATRWAFVPGRLVKPGRNVIALRLVSHTEKGGLSIPGKLLQLPVPDPNLINNDWIIKAEKTFPPLPPGALENRPKLSAVRTHKTATTLFNAMIHPLIPYGIRGAIWYQGENNAYSIVHAIAYRRLLPMMVGDWRARWQEGGFPFYVVQLANYDEVDRTHRPDPWPYLRESQARVAQTLPDSGLAVTIDLGSAFTVHPTDKQDVGARLANLALAKTYERKDVPYASPIYQSYTLEGDKVHIRFAPGSGELMVGEKKGLEPVREVHGGKLSWFEIAGEDRKFVWAEASIAGDSVMVSAAGVPRPVAVRYAWARNPEGSNLYSRAGLPVSPFRTDDWQ